MGALLLLGFASGLPLLLTGDTLQAWMKVEGVDLKTIGLFSLVGLPYSLKFLWSPFVDWLGGRRRWLVASQLILAVAIGAMAFQDPKTALYMVAVNALLVTFFSATQDIAFDAYRADVLSHREMGAGAAIAVLGYRLALLVAGSVALVAADHFTWPTIYVAMGLLMSMSIAATFFAPEPALKEKPPASLREAVTDPFAEFYRRSRWRMFAILGFIVLYKLGDSLAASMATPFLLELRFTMTDLGTIKGGVGLFATIVGTLAGGAILSKIGINRSLWIFGFLQMVSNLAYIVLSVQPTYGLMVSATIVENVCAGLGTAAFVAFLMSLCSVKFSATQFALLSSLMGASRSLLVAPAGGLAVHTGWPVFFVITLLAALPGLTLLPIFAPWNRRSPFGAAERESDVIEAARRET
jgi:PAT family beta-lactamase induction signal transducer AmpG